MFSLFSSFVLCFFKQKTAYEMRISDWSLDVCSSDLSVGHRMGFVEDDDSVKVLPCPFENLLEPGRVAAARAQCRIGDEEDALAHSDRDTELPLAKGLNVDRTANERWEGRRGGKECVSTWRIRGWAGSKKKKEGK